MYARACVWEPLYVFMEEICHPDLYQMYNMYSLRKTWNRLYIKTISPLTPKIYVLSCKFPQNHHCEESYTGCKGTIDPRGGGLRRGDNGLCWGRLDEGRCDGRGNYRGWRDRGWGCWSRGIYA